MKKLAKILLLSIATISLASCSVSDIVGSLSSNPTSTSADSSDNGSEDSNKNADNYGDSSNNESSDNSGSSDASSSSSNNNNNEKVNWTEAEAAIMSGHLYGEILPYTGSEDSVVAYDEEYDMVTVIGGDVDLDDYQAALTTAGYELLGEEEGYYAVQKSVTTDDGSRFVYVYVEEDEEDGFSLQAFDPYYYSFPSEAIAQFFADWEAEPFSIPEINKEGAYFSFQEDDGNIFYVLFGAEDYVNANLMVFGFSEADYALYVGQLETAGWDIEEKTEDGETYYTAKLEVEDKGIANIQFYYSSEYEGMYITIFAYMSQGDINPGTVYETWPASNISAILGSDITDAVPAYTGENNGFQILDDGYGTAVIVLVEDDTEEAAVEAYINTLTNTANYVQDGTDYWGDPIYVSPNGQINVTVYYATEGSFTITFARADAGSQTDAEWPATEVASAIAGMGLGITDVLPALDGAEDYYVYDGTSVQVQAYYSSTTAMYAAADAYVGVLKTAGWTEGGEDSFGDMNYNSPNNQVYACVWTSTQYASSGIYKVIIDVKYGTFVPATVSNTWPAGEIAEFMLASNFADPLPAYNDGTSYTVEVDDDTMYISVVVADPDAAVEAYNALLEGANFDFLWEDEDDGSSYYYSPNEEYIVNPYVSQSGNMVIMVY